MGIPSAVLLAFVLHIGGKVKVLILMISTLHARHFTSCPIVISNPSFNPFSLENDAQ